MYLEELLKANTAALEANTAALLGTSKVSSDAPTTSAENVKNNAPAPEKKADTPKGEDPAVKLAALKVKFSLLKKLSGGKACNKLLAEFDCKKFTDIEAKQVIFIDKDITELLEKAREKAKAAKVEEKAEVEETTKEETAPTVTFDQVKELLVQISNHDELGRDVAKDIIKNAGFKKMAEITADRYNDVHAACEIQLAQVAEGDL